MNYQERLDFIKSKIDKTEDKQKLNDFLDSIKTSDLNPVDKARFIDEIEIKLTGRKYTDSQVYKDIEESMPDYSDLNRS